MDGRGSDYVMVQLSKAGQEVAAGADGKGLAIGVGGGNYHFEFKRGEEPQRILKSDFERVLAKQVRVNEKEEAECLFELAPARVKANVPAGSTDKFKLASPAPQDPE